MDAVSGTLPLQKYFHSSILPNYLPSFAAQDPSISLHDGLEELRPCTIEVDVAT